MPEDLGATTGAQRGQEDASRVVLTAAQTKNISKQNMDRLIALENRMFDLLPPTAADQSGNHPQQQQQQRQQQQTVHRLSEKCSDLVQELEEKEEVWARRLAEEQGKVAVVQAALLSLQEQTTDRADSKHGDKTNEDEENVAASSLEATVKTVLTFAAGLGAGYALARYLARKSARAISR
jgi:hypothetical protein